MENAKQDESVSTRMLLHHSVAIMKGLQNKTVSVEEAKAQANLLKQSNNILRYELDRALALKKHENLEIREIEK